MRREKLLQKSMELKQEKLTLKRKKIAVAGKKGKKNKIKVTKVNYIENSKIYAYKTK
jgi:hypothetical protein